MNDQMSPPGFEALYEQIIKEYTGKKTVLGVKPARQIIQGQSPIGPAAGPHTQLAGNLVAAFVAGADHFEFKTIQVLEGEALGIKKPCIYSANEVYNSEWSSELTVEEATDEYVKAYILNYFLAIEYGFADPKDLHYIMSVGYDLEGIQSDKVTTFIDTLKDASNHDGFQRYQKFLMAHLTDFNVVTESHIQAMPSEISRTVALSTMHGCGKEEIEKIASYLMTTKGLDTYVKMNPTLLGKDKIKETFKQFAYDQVTINDHVFESDLTMDEALPMLRRLMKVGKQSHQVFGVKLTNTLPVMNLHHKIEGETVYLSGPALYPLTVQVALMIGQAMDGDLPISYSGGADEHNIKALVMCGLYPITVSSVLLKPGGYGRLGRMLQKLVSIQEDLPVKGIRQEALLTLVDALMTDDYYKYKAPKTYSRSEDYSNLCAVCKNCVDVCPNRANERFEVDGQALVIHYDDLCNACGNCSAFCIKGHDPYIEKYTVPHYSLDLLTTLRGLN